jgi:hypothetical protein
MSPHACRIQSRSSRVCGVSMVSTMSCGHAFPGIGLDERTRTSYVQ